VNARAPRLRDGIVTALITPFDEDDEVDWGALDALVDFQVGAGADGLFLLGTSGEGLLMAPAERLKVVERVLQRLDGQLPVVVHCGAADTRSAAELVRDAASAGAPAVAAIPPLFFPYGDSGVYEHFQRLADTAPDLDHYLYENPARTGYAMSTNLVHRLFAEVEPIRGVKDTGDSVGRISTYLAANADIQVFTGNNTIVLGALATGAMGAVSTTANVVPELFARLLSAFRCGDLDTARQLQLTATRLQRALDGLPYIAAAKYLLELRGLSGGQPRRLLPALSDRQRTTLETRIREDSTLPTWITAQYVGPDEMADTRMRNP
jgi:dihydrodipicolinate synthase/N-acetylneuraminate lyase